MEIRTTMIYSSAVQEPEQKTLQTVVKQATWPHFLVIGYSTDTKGDNAVGIQIANHISDWKIPSVKSIATYQLTPDLVNHLSSVDYAFFVSSCQSSSHARTLQIDPIFASKKPPRTERSAERPHSESTRRCTPIMLLNLAQQLYGRSPQAWLLQIPTANIQCKQELSYTAQRGCDRTLRTIEQFFMTYQQPHRTGMPTSSTVSLDRN